MPIATYCQKSTIRPTTSATHSPARTAFARVITHAFVSDSRTPGTDNGLSANAVPCWREPLVRRVLSLACISERVYAHITQGDQLLVFRHVNIPKTALQVPGGP